MIISKLKPCCYNCDFPDIEVENLDFPAGYAAGGIYIPSKTNAIIYCTHSRVCKNYIESEDE